MEAREKLQATHGVHPTSSSENTIPNGNTESSSGGSSHLNSHAHSDDHAHIQRDNPNRTGWNGDDSSDEDSDLEHDLEAASLLMGEEACSANIFLTTQNASISSGSMPNQLRETAQFDLVSPYKRLRLEDLTQSSMDSSQAAGEGEAHSLLRSRDNDADENVDEADLHSTAGSKNHVLPGESDEVTEDLAELHSQSSTNDANNIASITTAVAPKNLGSSNNNAIKKKKPSFLNNLLAKANFPRKIATSGMKQQSSNKLSNAAQNSDRKPKTPLKDVRNLAWAQEQPNTRKESFLSDYSPVSKDSPVMRASPSVIANMLSPQEMRGSIPFIDEVCMDEDPFMSADEREFPPPPAFDRNKKSPLKRNHRRQVDSVSLDSDRPDYQTLESRQILLEPDERTHEREKVHFNDPINVDANVYAKIGEDEDDRENNVEDKDVLGNKSSGCNTRIDPMSKEVFLSANSQNETSASNTSTNHSEHGGNDCKAKGASCDPDMSSLSSKSARSVGTSCANLPAIPPGYGLDAFRNMGAPSLSSAVTVETLRSKNSDEISGVYDTVDSLSDTEAKENFRGTVFPSEGSSCNNNLTSNTGIDTTIYPSRNNSGSSGQSVEVIKATISAGVSTDGLWDGQEFQEKSPRYNSHQELRTNSEHFETLPKQRSSSSHTLQPSSHHLNDQHPPQRRHKHSSDGQHLPMVFPHHHLDVVVEQSPTAAEERKVEEEEVEDLYLPRGISAKDFSKVSAANSSNLTCGEIELTSSKASSLGKAEKGIDSNQLSLENPENQQFRTSSAVGEIREFPHAAERFPSQDDLQQYLHQVEVENYLHHQKLLTQLQVDIEGAGSNALATGSEVPAQPRRSSSSILSRQSSGSQRQLSSSSLRQTSSSSLKHQSSGSLHHHSGRSDQSHGKRSERSSGSVHHHSRSSQGSTDLSNPGAVSTVGATATATTKRAVLQSSGKK
ncbi:hypothetical protein PoB_007207700 [Plakobranchus ocellatus]|uniref:Uncharacterized protein n=1 Tax=Plakobranchus ocellatus TaxID=259542 RepID=A0AAV4DMN5_9GAST|nr:hypothetical protein PoB_007207700 [Plakobranchus ocellatus]